MKVSRTSAISGKERTLDLPITQEQYDRWLNDRVLIQDAFPHLTPGQREFLLSGITDEEWDATFRDDNDDDDDDNELQGEDR